MADDKPIVIVKKKGGHGGHHGGAWKVAYADFVTAMMAFFMVMWLVNSSSQKTKESISSYFRRPGLFESGSGTPLMIGEAGILSDAYVPNRPEQKKEYKSGAENAPVDKRSGAEKDKIKEDQKKKDEAFGIIKGDDKTQGAPIEKSQATVSPDAAGMMDSEEIREQLQKIALEMKKQIEAVPGIRELLGLVDVKIDANGLKIEIMDTDKASMFASGNARILPEAARAFQKVAGILAKVPNRLDIVGHTDSKPFSTRGGMTNWELSSDRANAARRVLESYGIPPDRITSVVGRADRDLKIVEDPLAASNRRITVNVKFDLDKIAQQQGEETKQQTTSGFTEMKEIISSTPASAEPTAAAVESAVPAQADASASASPAPDQSNQFKSRSEVRAKESRNTIPEPGIEPKSESVTPPPVKIFKDNPVLGPADPFANF